MVFTQLEINTGQERSQDFNLKVAQSKICVQRSKLPYIRGKINKILFEETKQIY